MPIDPNIPLGYKPPIQATDPTHAYGQALALQGQALQNQAEQERIADIRAQTQSRQRAMAAEKDLAGLLAANTTVGDDGTVAVNHAAVQKGLAESGWGAEALKYDADRRADLTNALAAQDKQIQINKSKADRLGSLAGSIPAVDWTEKDPAKQQAQLVSASGALKVAMDKALAEGLIDKDHVAQMESVPYSPELEQQIQQFANQAKTSAQQHQEMLAHNEEVRKQVLFPAQKDEADAKATAAQLENAGRDVTGISNQDEWTTWRAQLPERIKNKIPVMYSPSAITLVKRMSLSPAQEASNDLAGKRVDQGQERLEQGQQRIEDNLNLGQQRVNLMGERLSVLEGNRSKPATKQQLATVEGKKQTALSKSTQQLQKDLTAARMGGIHDSDAETQAYQNHFERLQNAQNAYESELSTLTGNDIPHNDWADKLTPNDTAAQPAAAAPKATPPPTAAPAPPAKPAAAAPTPKPSAGKTATMADVQRYAAKYSITLDQAKAKAKAEGFEISK